MTHLGRLVLGVTMVVAFAACRPTPSPDASSGPSPTPIDTTAPVGWQHFEWEAGDVSLWAPPGWTRADEAEGLVVDASPQPSDPLAVKFVGLTFRSDNRASPGDYAWYDPTFVTGDWVDLPAGRARHAATSRGAILFDIYLVPRDGGRLYSLVFSWGDAAEDLAIARTLRFGPPPPPPQLVSCQPVGSEPALVPLAFPAGALTAAVAEQTATALFRACELQGATITNLSAVATPSTGMRLGPNAGQVVWRVQVDATVTEPTSGTRYASHFLIEVNEATGVPTIVALG